MKTDVIITARKEIYLQLTTMLREQSEVTDEEIYELIDQLILTYSRHTYLSLKDRILLRKLLFSSVRRLDVLSVLLDDEDVTEVMVNGTDAIFIEKAGKMEAYPYGFVSEEKLMDVVQHIASDVNRHVNEASPIVDARLKEDGSRVNIILPPVSLTGPIITVRRFSKEPITMEKLLEWESISEDAAQFLRTVVEARYNIFVSGGTGSGKTTFLGALSEFIPKEERIITIEDSAELRLIQRKNLVRLESRPENLEGKGEISLRDLIRSSLRMRPDRIILGEVRGKEALDMLTAMNTGHDGSLSTGHANSAKDMLMRLETMVLMGSDIPLFAVRHQIESAVDLIVHLTRMRDFTRRVEGIYQTAGFDGDEIQLEPLFQFQETGEQSGKILGNLVRTAVPFRKIEKIKKYTGSMEKEKL